MDFVRLCEELITEAELLEEASSALLSDPAIKELAHEMEDFNANFKKALRSKEIKEHDQVRQQQLGYRTKLKNAILKALAQLVSRASKRPIRTALTQAELDDYITMLTGQDKSYSPFRLLHSTNLEEKSRETI